MMAASISRSPTGAAAMPCARAKPATSALPRHENSQNAGRGRSPPRSTPKIAVASGNSPMKTIEWAEVMCFRASAVNNGKPTTTPSATMTSETRSPRAGRFSRKTTRRASPSKPAMTARATVRKTGSKSSTATRVAGSDPLKMSTPTNPLIHPLVVLSILISVSICIGREGVVIPDTMQYT